MSNSSKIRMSAKSLCQLHVLRSVPSFQTAITSVLKKGNDRIPIESVVETLLDGRKVVYQDLSPEENQQFHDGLLRLREIGQLSALRGVRTLVDAEYTYMNPAITLVTLAMKLVHNKSYPMVWNTYQCYLKQTYEKVEEDMNYIQSKGACFGLKLVRGAYMYKERKLSRQHGYHDPVHDTYEDTCEMYNKTMNRMLQVISASSPKTNMIIASHNEESVLIALRRMRELGIPADGGEVFFGQLFGMSDHISFTLGRAGHLVYKSVPYGTIDETIPYLVRRAQENRSVMAGVRRELNILQKAAWARATRYTAKSYG